MMQQYSSLEPQCATERRHDQMDEDEEDDDDDGDDGDDDDIVQLSLIHI